MDDKWFQYFYHFSSFIAKKLAGDKRCYAMKYVIQLNHRKFPIDHTNFLDVQVSAAHHKLNICRIIVINKDENDSDV